MKVTFIKNTTNKIVGLTSSEWYDNNIGKIVDFVVEHRIPDREYNKKLSKLYDSFGVLDKNPLRNIKMPYIVWRGETEDGYFIVCFLDGLLSVSFSEREMFLLYTMKNVGITANAYASMINTQSNPFEKMTEDPISTYLNEQYLEEVKNLTFQDVLDFLGWKIKDDIKIEKQSDYYGN